MFWYDSPLVVKCFVSEMVRGGRGIEELQEQRTRVNHDPKNIFLNL